MVLLYLFHAESYHPVTSVPFMHPISVDSYYHNCYHSLASPNSAMMTRTETATKTETKTEMSTEKTTTAQVQSRRRKHVIFVPGFQGTLLYHCRGQPSSCQPLFLSPLTPATCARTYDRLRYAKSPYITTMHGTAQSVDYASSTCAGRPFSHTGHCNAVPAIGPVQQLISNLSTLMPSAVVHTVPYDWRQSTATLLQSSSTTSFVTAMMRTMKQIMREVPRKSVSGDSERVVVVAHGTACRLLSHLLSTWNRNQDFVRDWRQRVGFHTVVCVAPTHPEQAVAALLNGSGMLTKGEAHLHIDACANVDAALGRGHSAEGTSGHGAHNAHNSRRVDFSHVDSYLGLNRRRVSLLSESGGAWSAPNVRFAATQAQRMSLAHSFPSVVELSASDGTMPAMDSASPVVCVEAKGAPRNQGNPGAKQAACPFVRSPSSSGTHSVPTIVRAADELDLVSLVLDTVLRLLADHNKS